MTSSIPTRRAAARRLDENAPPTRGASSTAASTVAAARLKPALQASGTVAPMTSASGIPRSTLPVMRRQQSTTSASASTMTSTGPVPAVNRRAALGEVTNAAKERSAVVQGKAREGTTSAFARKENVEGVAAPSGKDGKQAKEVDGAGAAEEKVKPTVGAQRRPLAPQPVEGARRTRSSMTTATIASTVKDEKPQMKRKTTAPAAVVSSRIPARTRAVAPTAVPSRTLKERKINVSRDPVAPEMDEVQPPTKRRKTLSPPAEVAVHRDVHDAAEEEDDFLADEALYDEDGKEVVLSSGGHAGTKMRSPKRAGRTIARPKDYGWTDLDAVDEGDPSMVSEYVIDAFQYMMDIERNTMANPNYMDKQSELQWEMRTILMDWIIEVHQKFRLLPETLFIAANLVDRFLSARLVSLIKLQLAGLTALFVASKYEEVICPSVTNFLRMTEDGFGIDEILKAERYLLTSLEFDMSYPNPLHFLRRISKADEYDIQTRTVAKYLIEIQLVEHRLLRYPPSLLAAAGMWMARLCLGRGEWHANLVHYSTYSEEEVLEPAQVMLDFITDPSKQNTSFFKKYASKRHMKSSVFMWQWAQDRWPDSTTEDREGCGNEIAEYIEMRNAGEA